MPEVLSWTSPAGAPRRAELHHASAGAPPRPAVALVGEEVPDAQLTGELLRGFAAAGWSTLLLQGGAAQAGSDRERTAEVEAALAALAAHAAVDERALALVGIGSAAAQAFLCACASRRVAAFVDLCGPLVREELDAARPVQPLDMALNLTAPILVVHAQGDAAFGSDAAQQATLRLRRAMRSVESLALPAPPPGFREGGAAGYHPEQARCASRGITAFLAASFDTQ